MLLAAQRRTPSPGRFSFAVIAGGESLKFHALAVSETSAAFEHHAALVLEHVPEQRLTDGAFWYLLFRAQLSNASLAQRAAPATAGAAAAAAASAAAAAATKAAASKLRQVKAQLKNEGGAGATASAAEQEGGGGGMDGASFLHAVLLPFLNCRTLLANVDPATTDWSALPVGGKPLATSHVASEAVRFVMRGSGLSATHASHLLVLHRWSILRLAEAELRLVTSLPPSDHALLALACRYAATLAADVSPALPERLLGAILATFTSIAARVDALRSSALRSSAPASSATLAPASAASAAAAAASVSPASSLVLPSSASAAGACYPFVGRLRCDTDVDHLAGDSKPSPIVLPCELTLVPAAVNSYEEAALAIRHCERLCTLLSNQQHLMRNSVGLRLALVQHTILELIPMPTWEAADAAPPPPPLPPLPPSHPDLADGVPPVPPPPPPLVSFLGFWQRDTMTVETQCDLLRTLHKLCRSYLATAFSLPSSPALDAARMTVVAGIACLMDSILLARVTASPSTFCEHYAGRAGGPTSGFCIGLGAYATESDSSLMLNPALALARPRLLEYAQARAASTRSDHVLFCFDRSMRPQHAESDLLSQLALATGLPPYQLPAYLAGSAPGSGHSPSAPPGWLAAYLPLPSERARVATCRARGHLRTPLRTCPLPTPLLVRAPTPARLALPCLAVPCLALTASSALRSPDRELPRARLLARRALLVDDGLCTVRG